MFRVGRLPLTVRIPLFVALLVLMICVTVISLSLHGLSRQFNRQVANLGQVYIDGLAAAVLPAVRAGEKKRIADMLDRALATHVGVVDRTLAILSAEGDILGYASLYEEVGIIPYSKTTDTAPSGTYLSADRKGIWAWKPLDDTQPELGTLIVNLDVSDFLQQRRELTIELVLAGLVVSLGSAGLGFAMARRLQRPIMLLTQRLRTARRDQPELIGPESYTHDPEMADLLDAYNWMVQVAHEREALASRNARIEREALLGRMSAALAHEIRNPLGGMRTAIQTLRQFGDRADVRMESLGFIDRGVDALQAVVDASLRTFRPDDMPLCQADIEDIRLMVHAQASRGNVPVSIHCQGVEHASLELPAAPVRQILLNLVLNAVRISNAGDAVTVVARVRGRALNLHVSDEGTGLPREARIALKTGGAVGGGMGLGIVHELVHSLHGRLRAHDLAQGTRISIRLPFLKRSQG